MKCYASGSSVSVPTTHFIPFRHYNNNVRSYVTLHCPQAPSVVIKMVDLYRVVNADVKMKVTSQILEYFLSLNTPYSTS